MPRGRKIFARAQGQRILLPWPIIGLRPCYPSYIWFSSLEITPVSLKQGFSTNLDFSCSNRQGVLGLSTNTRCVYLPFYSQIFVINEPLIFGLQHNYKGWATFKKKRRKPYKGFRLNIFVFELSSFRLMRKNSINSIIEGLGNILSQTYFFVSKSCSFKRQELLLQYRYKRMIRKKNRKALSKKKLFAT